MKSKLVMIVILTGLFLLGCKETNESEKYKAAGIKAEQNMQYEEAISAYAKSLQFSREDAGTWYDKGRCHLLLAMQIALVDTVSVGRELKISGNMNTARECFKRSEQWGLQSSSAVDSLQVWLLRSIQEDSTEVQ